MEVQTCICLDDLSHYFNAQEKLHLSFAHADKPDEIVTGLRVREAIAFASEGQPEQVIRPGDMLVRSADGGVRPMSRKAFETAYRRMGQDGKALPPSGQWLEPVQLLNMPKTEILHIDDVIYLMDLRVEEIVTTQIMMAIRNGKPLEIIPMVNQVDALLFSGIGGQVARERTSAYNLMLDGFPDCVVTCFGRAMESADLRSAMDSLPADRKDGLLQSWARIAGIVFQQERKSLENMQDPDTGIRALAHIMTGGDETLLHYLENNLKTEMPDIRSLMQKQPVDKTPEQSCANPVSKMARMSRQYWCLGRASDGVLLINAVKFVEAFCEDAPPFMLHQKLGQENGSIQGIRVTEMVEYVNPGTGMRERLQTGGMFLVQKPDASGLPRFLPASPAELAKDYVRASFGCPVAAAQLAYPLNIQDAAIKLMGFSDDIKARHFRDMDLIRMANATYIVDTQLAIALVDEGRGLPVDKIRSLVMKREPLEQKNVDRLIASRMAAVLAHQKIRMRFLAQSDAARAKALGDWGKLVQKLFGDYGKGQTAEQQEAFISQFCEEDILLESEMKSALDRSRGPGCGKRPAPKPSVS